MLALAQGGCLEIRTWGLPAPAPAAWPLGWLAAALPEQPGDRNAGRAARAPLGSRSSGATGDGPADSSKAPPSVGHQAIVRRVAVARPDLEEERVLCERAQSGDRAALGTLLRRYGPILYRSVLLPRLGSEASAQDALAETYARVIERLGQFSWQSCGFYPWLRVVGLRIALDALRARKREALYDPEDLSREIDASEKDMSATGEAELSEKRDLADARAKVAAALVAINPRYAEAIRLRVLEEKPREEVAKTLGVSVATFDVVLHRALNALKKHLAEGSSP